MQGLFPPANEEITGLRVPIMPSSTWGSKHGMALNHFVCTTVLASADPEGELSLGCCVTG